MITQLPAWLQSPATALTLLPVALAAVGTAVAVARKNRDLRQNLQTVQMENSHLGAAHTYLQEQAVQLRGALDDAREQIEAERRALAEARQNLALVQQERESMALRWEEQKSQLERSEERLQTQFENLANRIFEKKQQTFTQTSQQSLQHLMQPLREQLKDFRQRVDQVYEKDTDDRRQLRFELESLRTLNEQLNTEARALTNALKGEKKTQGNWGEMLLERILDESGLRKGHEYDTQVNVKNEAGQRQQPDAIIHLPDEKDIIVDAKVSLVDFERYVNADDEAERSAYLKAHLRAVRLQMENLSAKNYEQIESLRTLDFVLMFVPIEAAFLLAMEQDSMLFRDAFDRNIILVSPSTLLAVLKTIHNIWRNEQQNRNAMTIAAEAGKLYDQFVLFTESLQDVQKHLGKTQESLDLSVKRLSEGRGNAIRRVEKLRELGAKTKKRLPENL